MTAAETIEKWSRMPALAFDVESTGIDATNDRIAQAAIIEIHPGLHRPNATTWLINPGIEIPDSAAAIHGITTDHARTHGRDPEPALFEIAARLGSWLGKGFPVIAYNSAYDLTMLEAELTRHGIDTLKSRAPRGIQPIIDPYVLDKYADPRRRGSRKLIDLCKLYGVVHTGAHDAAADAIATYRLFPKIIAKHPEKFGGQTLTGLHNSQVTWRRDQMNSLRAYFDRTGKPHDGCDPGWPTYLSLASTAVGSL